jgi:hypothetical protein
MMLSFPVQKVGLFCLVAAVLIGVVVSQGLPICTNAAQGFKLPNTWKAGDPAPISCYLLISYGSPGVSWAQARSDCYAKGGTMAAIRNTQEATDGASSFPVHLTPLLRGPITHLSSFLVSHQLSSTIVVVKGQLTQ